MTEQQVRDALTGAIVLERDARAHWQAPGTPAAERQAALDVVRHVTPVIRALERWTAVRHGAAAAQQT